MPAPIRLRLRHHLYLPRSTLFPRFPASGALHLKVPDAEILGAEDGEWADDAVLLLWGMWQSVGACEGGGGGLEY